MPAAHYNPARPLLRPRFARLFFPCSAPKLPDNDLFSDLLISLIRVRNRQGVNKTTP